MRAQETFSHTAALVFAPVALRPSSQVHGWLCRDFSFTSTTSVAKNYANV